MPSPIFDTALQVFTHIRDTPQFGKLAEYEIDHLLYATIRIRFQIDPAVSPNNLGDIPHESKADSA